jgi:hypothetical protein
LMIPGRPKTNWRDFQFYLIFINIFDILFSITLIAEQKEGTGKKKGQQTFGD